MIGQFLLVFLGGGLGSLGRYLVSEITPNYYKGDFPLGTFIVNVVGCLVIGVFAAILGADTGLNAFFVSGFCGGFTTFSSFSKDTFLLIKKDKIPLALFYVISSSILGVLAAFVGFFLGGGKGIA